MCTTSVRFAQNVKLYFLVSAIPIQSIIDWEIEGSPAFPLHSSVWFPSFFAWWEDVVVSMLPNVDNDGI